VRKLLFVLVFCLPLFCLPVVSFADDGDEEEVVENKAEESSAPLIKLDDLVVTPGRGDEDIFNTPFAVGSYSLPKLQLEGMARTLPEAMLEEPGVMVQKTAHGHGSPYIRGFTGYHTLLLVDGIRVNNSVFRSGPNQYWTTVDTYSFERMEIVKGPSSVLYGSDALGGVVNGITIAPELSEEKIFGGRGLYRGASAEQSNTERLETFVSGKKSAVLAGGTYKNFDDLVCGRHVGLQPKTNYGEWFGDLKVVRQLTKCSKIVAAFYRARQHNISRTHKTYWIKSWRGTDVGSDINRLYDQDRDLAYIQLHVKGAEAFFQDAKFSLSWHEQAEELRRQKGGSLTVTHTGFRVGTLGFWAEMKSKTPFCVLTYGGEYYADTVNSYQKKTDKTTGEVTSVSPRGVIADESSYDLAGIFVQGEKKMTPLLTLTAGARYNHAAVHAGIVDPDPADAYPFNSFDESYSSTVGSLRAAYKARPDVNVIFGISQGFRAPNISDTTSFEDVRTNSVDVPTPGLDAENSTNCELGAKMKNKKVRGEIFYYYSMLNDFIRRVPTTYQGQQYADPPTNSVRYYGKENFGKGHVEGVEVKAGYTIDKEWSLFGNFMWMEGKGDDLVSGEKVTTYLSRMAPTRGRIGFRWDAPSEKCWVEVYSVMADRQEKLSPSDEGDTSRIPPGGTPGYVTYNIRGGIKIRKDMKVSAAVENVTNVDYRIHGSGVNAPGTNFVFSFELKF